MTINNITKIDTPDYSTNYQNQNTSTLQIVTPKSNKSLILLILIAFFLLLAIIATTVLNISLKNNKSINKNRSFNNLKTINNYPTTALRQSPTPDMFNPILEYVTSLTSNNYKITTSGKIEFSPTNDKATANSIIDYNYSTLFLQNSSFVRLEKNYSDNPQIRIIKNGLIYTLNVKDKTYSSVDINSDAGQQYYLSFLSSYPLAFVIEGTQKKDISWKNNQNNEWQTNWFWKDSTESLNVPALIKITFDPKSKLINSISYKFNPDLSWQTINIKHEKFTNIESLLSLPAGYTEQKLP